jgi:DNA-binding NarL/FixJ family response regulator
VVIAVAIWAADATAREDLASRFGSAPGITVIGVAECESELLRLLEASPVDVAVVQMSGGIASCPVWLAQETAVVAIVGTGGDILDALRVGAQAALPRSAGSAELVAAIQGAAAGLSVLPAERLDELLSADRPLAAESRAAPDASILTPREAEVLALMAEGASNKMIARRLGISAHTAKFHVASIFAKLGAASRAEAVAIAARLGLVML